MNEIPLHLASPLLGTLRWPPKHVSDRKLDPLTPVAVLPCAQPVSKRVDGNRPVDV